MGISSRVKQNSLLLLIGFLSTLLTSGVAIAAKTSGANAEPTASAQAPTASEGLPPAPPTSLIARAGNSQVMLSWAASSSAISYHVKRSTSWAGPYVLIAVSSTTTFVDSGLANGTIYFYAVSAVNSFGKGANSSSANAQPTAAAQARPPSGLPPAPPTSLIARAGNSQVMLSWAASSSAISYHVKRSTSWAGPYVLIAVSSTTTFIDSGLANGTIYFYAVSAVNSFGKGTNSSSANAQPTAASAQTPPVTPATPTGLTAAAGNAEVRLSWTACTGATSYQVTRATTSGEPSVLVGVPSTSGFIDSGLKNNTTYLYAVSAVSSVGQSTASPVVSAEPSAPAATAASITISPTQPSVAIGSKVQLSATANSADGSTQDVTASLSWTSSDPSKLSVSSSGVAEGLASGTVTVSGDYNGLNVSTDVSVSIGDIQWSGPIVITSGGTYSGNWESTNPNVHAVIVNTKDPVIIQNSHIRGPATLISAGTTAGDLTVLNTVGLALNPNVAGLPDGLFLDASSPARVVVENCYMENTLYGVRVSGYAGNRDGNQTIIIRYNRGRNMTGLLSDGHGGQFVIASTLSQGSNSYRKYSHFIQLKQVQGVPGIDIGWNEVVDEPYKSNVDDVINIYQASGTPDSMLVVHDSYIQGAYPYNPTLDHYSGGGIIADGATNDTPATATAYSSFHDNQVVSTTNYGIQFAAGHSNVAFNNRIVSSGLLANGAQITLQNVGLVDEDSYGTNVGNGSMYANSMHDNIIGWMCWRSRCASSSYRDDMYLPVNSNDYANNVSIKANPITFTMEANEYQIWLQKLQTSSITIGPSFQ